MFYEEILQSFLGIIERYGECNAFCINGKYYSYNDFWEEITRIRSTLLNKRIASQRIGLVVNDDLDTYSSIFALWFEGASYVPLYPNQSSERNHEIIQQSGIELILNSKENAKSRSFTSMEGQKLSEPYAIVDDNSLAYILFTSGSTGIPKGVQVSRRNLAQFVQSFWQTGIILESTDRCLQCFDLTFDVSVQSFLLPLLRGACVYTVPQDQIKYSYVSGLLEDYQLTFGAMAPSMIRYLRPYFNQIRSTSLRYCIMTAEASPVELIKEWSDCIPNAEIFNFYGPTEATIYCTYHKFQREKINKHLNGMMSIGKPMKGITAVVINDAMEVLPTNQKGELCISGDQVTSGYWGNTSKNKEVFFEMNHLGSLTRFYKTGDCCYFDEDGDIMLIGRLDHQVKIQGYRIELGEIEYHSRTLLSGLNAIAVTYINQLGNTEIALFIECETIEESELREYLKKKLPNYMIPSKLIAKRRFPINSSGKVDRLMLINELN